MGVKERELQTISTIADDDKIRIVTAGGGSKSMEYADLQNRIKQSIGGAAVYRLSFLGIAFCMITNLFHHLLL